MNIQSNNAILSYCFDPKEKTFTSEHNNLSSTPIHEIVDVVLTELIKEKINDLTVNELNNLCMVISNHLKLMTGKLEQILELLKMSLVIKNNYLIGDNNDSNNTNTPL